VTGPNNNRGNGLDLSHCDREPIHIPGAIQPHGFLVVVDPVGFLIRQVSSNSAVFTGRDAAELLGDAVNLLLGEEPTKLLKKWSSGHDETANRSLMLEVKLGVRRLSCMAHRAGKAGWIILEIEPGADDQNILFQFVYRRTEAAIGRFEQQATLEALTQSAAAEMRALTGFDRIMIYRFEEDYSGTVVAEDKLESLPAWLGLCFPASDIPAQARELYLRNRIRSIPDVGYLPAPIVPPTASPNGPPLDLSHASLRSVSPVHLEYLRNMQVAASMSVSIVKEGRLWGLIACHHGTPRQTPPDVRFACSLLGQTLSLLIGAKEESSRLEKSGGLRQAQLRLLQQIAEHRSVFKGFDACPTEALAAANGSGVAICCAGRYTLLGDTPDLPQVEQLVEWLDQRGDSAPFVTNELAASFPLAGAYVQRAAGILAVPLQNEAGSHLIWFRREVVREVRWAGDPNKSASPAADASQPYRLHPRKSFEAWKQLVAGKSAPWMIWEVETALSLAQEVSRQLMSERAEAEALARQKAEAERDQLAAAVATMEQVLGVIGHELRTPLAAVGAMADFLLQPQARQRPEFDAFLTSLGSEISKMSSTLNNLVEAARLASGHGQWEWSDVPLAALCSEAPRHLKPSAPPSKPAW
jgi:chemotaxis family two-component system sensor kinase Cph1